MNIVFYQPEIPQNTGNIIRLCANTGVRLVLIEPLGFSVEDRYLRRAGLDYHAQAQLVVYPSWAFFLAKEKPAQCIYFTTKASAWYTQAKYTPRTFLVFGPESRGLPSVLLDQSASCCYRLPMCVDSRSLNVANAVAVVVYEGLRQQGFPGLR